MPKKKQKLDKRLNTLFDGVKPEEGAPAKSKRPSKVTREAGRPAVEPNQAASSRSGSHPRGDSQSLMMQRVEAMVVDNGNEGVSPSLSLAFQMDQTNWATLRAVDEEHARTWSTDDQLLVKQVTDQLSLAIENANLFQETQTALTVAEHLYSTSRAIASAQTEEEIITSIVENLDRTHLDRIMVAAAENIDDELWAHVKGVWDRSGKEAHFINNRFNAKQMPAISKTMDGTILLIDDFETSAIVDNATRAIFKHLGVKSAAIFPIRGQTMLGWLLLETTQTLHKFTEENIRPYATLIDQMAVVIESRRNEQALAKSEADLRALFASMEDVVLVVDKDARYLRIAPTNPARLIRPPDELLGKTMHEVLPKETADRSVAAIRQTLKTGETVQIEYELPIGAELVWFLASLSKLNEDNVFWVARDITSRKQAEEALQRRNTYLAASADISRLVTSTLDLNTIFKRTVSLVCERFGYYHAGIFIIEETGFNANLQEASGEAGEALKAQRHSLRVGSNSIVGGVTQSGEAVVVNDVSTSPLHKINLLLPDTKAEAAIPLRVGSRIIGALDLQSLQANAFSEDDMAVLQTLADQVAVAIDNARSYELSMQAVKEMREIDRLKTTFLANMSHELRTPLNSIIGFSRVIIKGIDGPITELQQTDLTAIYNSGQHLLGLINDILDLSKIEAGKMELAFEEVSIGDLISSVMSTVAGLVKDKPIRLVKHVPEDIPHARADPIRVRQVLINLFSNASKFTEQGDITVTAQVQTGATGKPEIKISVTDTGPGIAKKDQNKLFQPFSQVDDLPTRKTGGSGLGLSISQRLIHMHGGQIGLQSDVGQGSTFYFTLPVYQEAASNNAHGKLILAIDDDPQVISLYERYLTVAGYQVVALSDPSQAVKRVAELKPFAVTLDIMMPGIDGWQVLGELKSNPETRDVPVMICSIIEEQERGFSLGAAEYLVKPILEEDMVRALDLLNVDGSIREVLVIDDDPNDLSLIGKMLADHGRYQPILAQGGEKGWEIILNHPPQAVILDLFMPGLDGFAILEKMRASKLLSEVPVVVVSSGDLTAEQRKQLSEYGQQLISKSTLSERDLVASLEHALQRLRKS